LTETIEKIKNRLQPRAEKGKSQIKGRAKQKIMKSFAGTRSRRRKD